MRIFVDPWADQRLRLVAETFDSQQRRIAITIRPAGNDDSGNIETSEILADRAVPPEVVAALMLNAAGSRPLLTDEDDRSPSPGATQVSPPPITLAVVKAAQLE